MSQKSEERRKIFEKLQYLQIPYRKAESEKKLKTPEENLIN
jgi:hypothetical protein